MSSSWSPLWSTIVTSTLWGESKEVRITFVTMLAIKDYQTGCVFGTTDGLARIANLSIEECRSAIQILESPDVRAETHQEFDGRRIEKIDGGWRILNHEKYRDMVQKMRRKAAGADWQKKNREPDTGVPSQDSAFERFWSAYPKQVGRGNAERIFEREKCAGVIDQIIAALKVQVTQHNWTKEGGQYIPYPATWLNGHRWTDGPTKINGVVVSGDSSNQKPPPKPAPVKDPNVYISPINGLPYSLDKWPLPTEGWVNHPKTFKDAWDFYCDWREDRFRELKQEDPGMDFPPGCPTPDEVFELLRPEVYRNAVNSFKDLKERLATEAALG